MPNFCAVAMSSRFTARAKLFRLSFSFHPLGHRHPDALLDEPSAPATMSCLVHHSVEFSPGRLRETCVLRVRKNRAADLVAPSVLAQPTIPTNGCLRLDAFEIRMQLVIHCRATILALPTDQRLRAQLRKMLMNTATA